MNAQEPPSEPLTAIEYAAGRRARIEYRRRMAEIVTREMLAMIDDQPPPISARRALDILATAHDAEQESTTP